MSYKFGLKPLKELARAEVMLKSKFAMKPLKQIVVPEIITEEPIIPFIFVLVGGVGENAELHLYASADGTTWQQVIIATPTPGTTPWWPCILSKNGKLNMFFNQAGSGGMQHILYLSSEDNGLSFSDIFDAGEVNDWPQIFDAVAWGNGLLWTAYATGQDEAPYPIESKYSEDNGESWEESEAYADPSAPHLIMKSRDTEEEGHRNVILYKKTLEDSLIDGEYSSVNTYASFGYWATARGRANADAYYGIYNQPQGVYMHVRVSPVAYGSPGEWQINRSQMSFDTSEIGVEGNINRATISFLCKSKSDELSPAGSICLVTFLNEYDPNQAGGFSRLGEIQISEAIPLADISLGDTVTFELNETGIENIDRESISRFGLRMLADVSNSEPTWEESKIQSISTGVPSMSVELSTDNRNSCLVLGLPYQGMPPSLVEVGHVDDAVPDSQPDMDYVGEKIFIVYTGEDENTYGYISDEDGNGLGDPAMLIKEGAYVLCCGINRNTPDTLYAVVIDSADWETIYLCTSTDNGETWDAVEICKGWNASKMSCEGDHFYFLVERVDDEYNQTAEIYSNKWNGFSRIPQLDGEASLTYNRAVAASNV